MDQEREYEVVLDPQPEGGFTVTVPDLPGVITEGDTVDEALAMAADAIESYLEVVREQGIELPHVERRRVVVHQA